MIHPVLCPRLSHLVFNWIEKAVTPSVTRRCDQDQSVADSTGLIQKVKIMRTFIAFLFLAGGFLFALHGWLPEFPRIPLPTALANWAVPIGIGIAACGLLLLRQPRRKLALGDRPLVSTLEEADFHFISVTHGWQAEGTWKRVPLIVRKSVGHDASRFGRPWTIVVTLPGQPLEPWPFMPEEGLIVERRKDDFSVAMADLSRPEKMHRLGERLNQLLTQRSSSINNPGQPR